MLVKGKTRRIEGLRQKMTEAGVDAALIIYSRDLLYYTGTTQPSVLVVTPSELHFFVRRGYDFAIAETWLDKDKVVEESRLEAVADRLKDWGVRKGVLGLELDAMSAETYLRWQKLLPDFKIIDVSPLILEQRKVKDEDEVACVREACRITDAGHSRTLEVLKEGMTELELSAAVEDAHRRGGHEGLFFVRHPDFLMSRGPISSGANLCRVSGSVYSLTGIGLSPSIRAGPSQKKIGKGEPIVIDIPACYQGYHGDQTRTYVIGKASPVIRSLYESLRDISDYVILKLNEGVSCKDIYQLAWQRARELEVADYFQNLGRGSRSNFVGHGIGLELNEPPVLSDNDDSIIHKDFTVALDMHMLHPEEGAVKLEDIILITDRGAEILNVSPRELFEV